MQAFDENKEIDIPEIVIHKNKKVTFDDEKNLIELQEYLPEMENPIVSVIYL